MRQGHPHFAQALVFLLLAGWPLAAQTAKPTPGAADDFISEKGFRSGVFEIHHRDPGDLASVLRPLGSGFRGATISSNRELRTISVRDFPENVTSIEAAIKRLDVPGPARPDVELHLYVLVASRDEGTNARYPEELAQAVAALKSTLQYKSYTLAASFAERARDGSEGLSGEGIAEIRDIAAKHGPRDMQVQYRINRLSVDLAGASPVVRLDGFNLALEGGGRAQVKTDVSLKDGEKVVVGTSTVQDKGLIVVVSARILR